MTNRVNLANPSSEISDMQRRQRDARRSATAEHASISRGTTRVLSADGDALAAFGHIAGKSGLLLNVGGEWRTVQEHVDARIATAFEYPDQRLENLENFANTFGPTVNQHGARIAAAEGDIADLEGRMAAAEGGLAGKASTSSVSDLTAKVNEVIDQLNDLQQYVQQQHPTKPLPPPIVKG